jgi:hypothetical protein
MPKDPARNQPNYKIGGGQLNEFEYARNQGAMTEAEHERFQQQQAERAAGEESAAQSAPQTEAERIQQLMADVHEKVERRKQKAQGAALARPAARKDGAQKSVAKAGAKKSAQKGGAKKSAAKAGAKKSAARAGASKTASKVGAKKRAPGTVKQSVVKGGGKGAGSKKSARAAGGRAGGKKGARKSAR